MFTDRPYVSRKKCLHIVQALSRTRTDVLSLYFYQNPLFGKRKKERKANALTLALLFARFLLELPKALQPTVKTHLFKIPSSAAHSFPCHSCSRPSSFITFCTALLRHARAATATCCQNRLATMAATTHIRHRRAGYMLSKQRNTQMGPFLHDVTQTRHVESSTQKCPEYVQNG